MKKLNDYFPLILLLLFSIFWIILAINPHIRFMWIIENTILIIFLIILLISYKWYKFSNISYFLIFLFAILQTIGAHYTYANVPIDFFTNLFGWQRNHFDRLVHFSFGFLLGYPFREFLIQTSKLKSKFWTYYVPVEMAFATGAIYEIIEWIFAVSSDPNASAAFLGSQGDIWDAQIDMFLAGIGSIIAMLITYILIKFSKFKSSKNI